MSFELDSITVTVKSYEPNYIIYTDINITFNSYKLLSPPRCNGIRSRLPEGGDPGSNPAWCIGFFFSLK